MISEKEDIQQSHRATNLLCHASKRDEIGRTYPFREKNEFGEFWQIRTDSRKIQVESIGSELEERLLLAFSLRELEIELRATRSYAIPPPSGIARP